MLMIYFYQETPVQNVSMNNFSCITDFLNSAKKSLVHEQKNMSKWLFPKSKDELDINLSSK